MITTRQKLAKGYGIGDFLLSPIAPPKGGSVVGSLAAATAIGAGLGMASDVAMDRFGLNDPGATPDEARRRRLRRGLYGAAAGLGTSALTNAAVSAANNPKSTIGKHLSLFKRSVPERGSEPLLPGGSIQKLLVKPGSDIETRVRARMPQVPGPWNDLLHGPPPKDLSVSLGRMWAEKKAAWRASDDQLKRQVMADSAIPFETKRIMFRQIDEATRGSGRSASMDSLIHQGGGAIAGYFAARAAGAGPVQRGISAVVGAMIGGAVLENQRSDSWTYTPGFKTYR